MSEQERDGGIEQHEHALMTPGRLEAFSDGVMAIIITIMAFGIKAPAGPSWAQLSNRVPQLLIYALSFIFVGMYWNNHHHLLRSTRRIDGTVMWANLFLLFWLSLIPFATQWVGNYYAYSLAAAAYGVVAFGAGFAYWLLVRAIVHVDGENSVIGRMARSDVKGKASIVIYLAAIGLAFVSPWISYALYVTVAIMWFIPDRRLSRQDHPEDHGSIRE